MKKQIALVLTFVSLLIAACDDTDPRPGTGTPLPAPSTATVIRSIHPTAVHRDPRLPSMEKILVLPLHTTSLRSIRWLPRLLTLETVY